MQSNITQFCCSYLVCEQPSKLHLVFAACVPQMRVCLKVLSRASPKAQSGVQQQLPLSPHSGNSTCPAAALHTHCLLGAPLTHRKAGAIKTRDL